MDVIVIIDAEGKIAYKSPNIKKIYGWDPQELIGKDALENIHPDDLDSVSLVLQSILANENASNTVECRYRCKDGSYKWIKVCATNLLHDKDIKGVLGSYQDITEQKKAEGDFIIKDAMYTALYHNLKSAISVYKVITNNKGRPVDYQFVSVNSDYEKTIEKKESELIGKTLLEVFPHTEKVWLDTIEKVYYSGKPVSLEDYSQEVDKFFELVIYRPQAGMIALIGTDITDRKKAERQLKISEERYRNIIEGLNEAIYRMSLPDGTYEYFSPAVKNIFGYSAEEFLSNPLLIKKIIHPDFNDYFKIEYDKLINGNLSPTYEYKIIDPDGGERWIFQSNKGIFNENGEIIAIEGLCRNITEKKKAEEDLLKSESILKATIESLNEGLLIVNSEGKITHSNSRFKEIFHIPDDISSLKDDKILLNHAKKLIVDPESFSKNTENIYKTNESTEDLLYLIDNQIIERISYPLQEESPIKGRVWLFRDITSKKHDEEELVKFKFSIEYTKDGVFWMNKDGSFEYVNEQACKMLGYTYEELITKNLTDIAPYYPIEVFNKNWENFEKERKNVGIYIEASHKRKDGTLIPVEVNSNHVMVGDRELHVAYTRDITERKKYEEKLLKNQKFLTESQRVAHIGCFEHDIQSKIMIWNEETYKIFGFNDNEFEITTEKYKELIHPDDLLYVLSKLQEVLENHVFEDYEYRIIRKDGKVRTIIVVGDVELNEKGEVSRIFGIIQDITERKEAEEQLKKAKERAEESEMFLKDSQEAGKIGSYRLNLETGSWISTETLDRIYGISDSYDKDVAGWLDIVHPDDREYMNNYLIDEVISKKQFFDKEYRIIRKSDNETRWVYGIGKLISDDKGNLTEMIGTIQDVTERRTATDALVENEKKLASIFNSTTDLMSLITVGSDGFYFAAVNRAYINAIEALAPWVDTNGLVGTNTKDLFKQLNFTDEYLNSIVDVYNRIVKQREIITTIDNLEIGGQKIILDTAYTPVLDNENNCQYILYAARNITELKNTEAELIKKNEEYLAANKALKKSIKKTKKINKELNISKERAEESEFFLQESQRAGNIGSYKMDIKSGYWISTETLDQILGIDDSYNKNVEGWLSIVHPEEREKMQNYLLNEVFAKNQPFDYDYRIVRVNDNSVRWLHGSGNLYHDKKGNLISMQGTIQDITDRKLIEDERKRINSELESRVMERTAQLNKANKDLESFAYSVSHDLRAPVRHIGGFVELLSNMIQPLDEKAQGYFDKINTSVKGMSEMIDELLSFSRLGRAELHYSDVDLNSIIDTILNQSKLDYIEREIEWKINKLPIVKGDPTLLKIVLENLISNAVKYTSKKELAIIEIGELNPGPHFMTLYVKDNGVGFDMMFKDKIFKVFQRLHKKEDFEGIGVGLANVEQILKKHNGTIDVESEVNKGTTFFITLPL